MITKILLAGFLSSAIWFIIGGGLYMNPLVKGIYKKFENAQGLKKWSSTGSYLIYIYVFILIQCLLFAIVYNFIKPVFADSILTNTLIFGAILTAIKIIPRLLDMWTQTTYPNRLLAVELINGLIGSFVMAAVIVWMI